MRLLSLFALLPLALFGEQTFSMVKPEAVSHANEIMEMYKEGGLNIVETKQVQLTKEEAEQFYEIHKDRPFYGDLVTYISSGPVVGVIVEGDDAVLKVREIMGSTDPKKAAPGTIRARFGTSIEKNAVHGSDSVDSAKKEIQFFFHDLSPR